MQKGNVVVGAAALIASVLSAQVLSPPEILDPAMRALQQKHFPELKAAAVDITAHDYPHKFFLSRKLDLTEKQEKLADQRAIRFSISRAARCSRSPETTSRRTRMRRWIETSVSRGRISTSCS